MTISSQTIDMIACSYHDIADLCEISDESNKYYKKSVMLYLRNVLEDLLYGITSIDLEKIENFFMTEQNFYKNSFKTFSLFEKLYRNRM